MSHQLAVFTIVHCALVWEEYCTVDVVPPVVVSHCWLVAQITILTSSDATFDSAPLSPGAQWRTLVGHGGQTLAVGGKCKGEDILQTHNCTSLSQSHLSLLSSSSDDD